MNPIKVSLVIPTSDGRVRKEITSCLYTAGKHLDWVEIDSESAFVFCLNRMLAKCLNDRKDRGTTHMMILHSDIAVHTPKFVDKMIEIMEKAKADVLSVVVPLKQFGGITSTGIEDIPKMDTDNILGFSHQKMTLQEISEFPQPTFTHPKLLLNTGVMLIDLRKSWAHQYYFDFKDGIQEYPPGSGNFIPVTLAEDWGFSRRARELGASLWATTEVHVSHLGNGVWSNQLVWSKNGDKK